MFLHYVIQRGMVKVMFSKNTDWTDTLTFRDARWPCGRASDSGARCRGFDPHSGRPVVSLSKIYSPVIPRKRCFRPDMTEKLFTLTLSKNETKNETLTFAFIVENKYNLKKKEQEHLRLLTENQKNIFRFH